MMMSVRQRTDGGEGDLIGKRIHAPNPSIEYDTEAVRSALLSLMGKPAYFHGYETLLFCRHRKLTREILGCRQPSGTTEYPRLIEVVPA